jgi:CBS domain-containing protein
LNRCLADPVGNLTTPARSPRPGIPLNQRDHRQEYSMKVSEIMTRGVQTITPGQTIHEAAAMMARLDCGALLVNQDDRLVGMITDRDITVRAVATGMPGETPISEVMSGEIRYCFEDEEVREVARNMGDNQLRRLPVLNREKRLVGVVSLGNIAAGRSEHASATVLQGVAQAH